MNEELWPIDDILGSLETECMIGVKLEKDGKISSEERRRRVREAHSIAFNKLAPMTQQGDRQLQMQACKELAPQGLLYALSQPWKALENALRNRNFENKQLVDRVAELETEVAQLKQSLAEKAECEND